MSDQNARERAVSEFKKTILVEAGAGTGKTTLLVKRIRAMIESEIKPDRIAAVTFTVKAAGELKERLRKELNESHSEHARAALENLDRMTVNTIHGMAAEFLRTLPVEAKLPPEFTALDEFQQLAAIEEFRDYWLNRALDGDVPEALELAELAGLDLLGSEKKGLGKLFDVLVKSMVDHSYISTGCSSRSDIDDQLTIVSRCLRDLVSCRDNCATQDDKLSMGITRYEAWFQKLPRELYSPAALEWFNEFVKTPSNQGTQTAWGKENLAQAKTLHANFLEEIAKLKSILFSVICYEIVQWIAPAVEEFRQSLRTRGTISFDDQLMLCRDMLHDSKTARDYFKARYDFVHIDEFQDTDPVQVEILFYLCEDKKAHAGNWSNVTLEPGKLFIVGDPKQSIYRFRGADVRIYNHVARRIETEGEKLAIIRNFRSRPTILSEVNAIIAPHMLGRNEYEANYEALVPREGAEDDDLTVELLLPPTDYDRASMSANQAAKWESAAIADHIQSLARNNKNLNFSQVAVLMRAGTKVSFLQEALSARDIPFVSFINDAYVSRVEIETMLTILQAIANPQHTVAVIGALRSPWYAVSDDDIFAFKISGGSFVYTDSQVRNGAVGEALDDLLKWHTNSKQKPVAVLLEELLASRPIEILYGLKSEGSQRVQNIHVLVEHVRRLEQSGVTSLSRIVERVSAMKKLVQNTELDAQDSNHQAVQIMSLHKAKGLEFKVVYLYQFDEKKRNDGEWIVLKSLNNTTHELGMQVSSPSDYKTVNWKMLELENEAAQAAELNRLLYVGMTRAKEKLVLPLAWQRKGKKGEPRIALPLLQRYPLDNNQLPSVTDTNAASVHSEAEIQLQYRPLASRLQWSTDSTSSASADFDDWQAQLNARVAALRPAVPTVEDEESEVDWKRVRARKIGTYVHAVLEQLAKGRTLADAIKLAARGMSLSESEQSEADGIIDSVRNSQLFTHELPNARRVLTELPIIGTQDGYVASKFVDLMFETESGEWVLLDYKSDDIPLEAVPERAKHHSTQINLYAEMFNRVFGKPPSEKRVYFLRPNKMVPID